jgi:hypothetical protein
VAENKKFFAKPEYNAISVFIDGAPDSDTLLTSFVQYVEDLIKKHANKSNTDNRFCSAMILFASSRVTEKLKEMKE